MLFVNDFLLISSTNKNADVPSFLSGSLIQEELDDIIRYGSKELFADDNDEAGKSRQIHYDDAAIDRQVLFTQRFLL